MQEYVYFNGDDGFSGLEGKFPEMFRHGVLRNVPRRTVILGFHNSVYKEYLENSRKAKRKYLAVNQGKSTIHSSMILEGYIYRWQENLSPRDKIGLLLSIWPKRPDQDYLKDYASRCMFLSLRDTITCAEYAEFNKNQDAREHEYTWNKMMKSYSRFYETLSEFCNSEL